MSATLRHCYEIQLPTVDRCGPRWYCLGTAGKPGYPTCRTMTLTTTIAVLAALLLLPVLIILWASEDTNQRCRRLRSYGWSQRRIADHMNVSMYRVRKALIS